MLADVFSYISEEEENEIIKMHVEILFILLLNQITVFQHWKKFSLNIYTIHNITDKDLIYFKFNIH